MCKKTTEIVAREISLAIRADSASLAHPDGTEFAPGNHAILHKKALIQISKTFSKMGER
jgi:hypothetical protein